MALTCPGCGYANNNDDARFCSGCGAPLVEAATAAPPTEERSRTD